MEVRFASATTALVIAGCRSGSFTVFPESPDLQSSRTLIYAFVDSPEHVPHAVTVTDVSGAMPIEIQPPADSTIHLLFYSESLADLRVTAGTLLDAGASPGAIQLPTTQHGYVATVSGGQLSSWSPATEPSGVVANFLYLPIVPAIECPAPVLDHVVWLPTTGEIQSATWADNFGILATSAGEVFMMAANGPLTRLISDSSIVATEFHNHLWVADAMGRIGSATISGSPPQLLTSWNDQLPVSERIERMVHGASTNEVAVMTSSGSVWANPSGANWALANRFPEPPAGMPVRPGLALLTNAILAVRTSTYVVRIEPFAVSLDTLPGLGGRLIMAHNEMGDVGATVGSSRGELFHPSAAGWAALSTFGSTLAISAAGGYHTNIYLGSTNGSVWPWLDNKGCPPVHTLGTEVRALWSNVWALYAAGTRTSSGVPIAILHDP
jgi:hypothetical protein